LSHLIKVKGRIERGFLSQVANPNHGLELKTENEERSGKTSQRRGSEGGHGFRMALTQPWLALREKRL
jgi:hypothetical protein